MGLDPVQRLQYVDIHTFLLDNLLLKSDKLSMAHSLEVRVPLLDRPLLELGLSLPSWAKVSRTRTKTLLRRLLRKELGGPRRGPSAASRHQWTPGSASSTSTSSAVS